MGLYIDRNKLKIMHGETKYDYTNHKYIPDGPAQDVTKEMLKLMYNYFMLAIEKREKNGQQASFQISSPNIPYVLKMIKTDAKKSDFIPVFEENDFPTTITSLSEVVKKIPNSTSEETNTKYTKQEKSLMPESVPVMSDNNKNKTPELKTTLDIPEASLESKPKRHRRTKAEMMAAREAEAKKTEQLSFIGSTNSDIENDDTKKRGRRKKIAEE